MNPNQIANFRTISNEQVKPFVKVSHPNVKPSKCIVEKFQSNNYIKNHKNNLNKKNLFSKTIESPDEEKNIKETCYSLSKKFQEMFIFKVYEEILYVWEEKVGYYIPLTNESSDVFFRKRAPKQYKSLINSRNIKEIVS